MSLFDEQFLACSVPVLQAGLGDVVVYTPSGGAAVNITALLTRHAVVQRGTGTGLVEVRRLTLQVLAEDMAGVPARGDVFLVEGVSYGVEEVKGPEGGMYEVLGALETVKRIGGTWE